MFITNENEGQSLLAYINEKIPYCKELKILVGYFYFSGLQTIIDAVKEQKLKLKILVGLDADVFDEKIVELCESSSAYTKGVIKNKYIESLKKVFNHNDFDHKKFYENIKVMIEAIKNGTIEIRKTQTPNHAKLYIFKMDEQHQKLIDGFFVTGSSNLTYYGLSEQNEFNVSIKDYGFKEAEQYFDKLWDEAIAFSDKEKEEMIRVITDETLVKKITPFEAYVYILKTYLDSFQKKEVSQSIQQKMIDNGYQPYTYQLDAIGQALSIIEQHNGVVIADVVGLGKSIIACAVAFELKKRGIVVAPPGLIGDAQKNTGWRKYLEDFGLAALGWEAYSSGKLEEVFYILQKTRDIEVVIIDEAHRYRNNDTQSYHYLHEICRNKKVILLTATPFNNRPNDIFSLLKLFISPKKSTITYNADLDLQFSLYERSYKILMDIKKNYNSYHPEKQKKAIDSYNRYFNSDDDGYDGINMIKVNNELKRISNHIKQVLMPIMIRRNRLDLKKHPRYEQDVGNLSEVKNPEAGFYELDNGQSEFYNNVIDTYFSDITLIDSPAPNSFRGAIYMPFKYIKTQDDEHNVLFQTNLYLLMRRLLVKRFESSFGAFYQTIDNFINIHEKVKEFISRTGYYILDRDWIDKISDYDDEDFLNEFTRKVNEITEEKTKTKNKKQKNEILYSSEDLNEEFFTDIEHDIRLLYHIKNEVENLNLLSSDPKADTVFSTVKQRIQNEPKRKIIIFSEFEATVTYLKTYIKKYPELATKTLFVYGNIAQETYEKIYSNFDASFPKEKQKNDYDILICTDKLSEGFNLNRAGFIINYDIPWNPVRVIQRLGRINRISKKVFDELYLMNFFPTERGESEIKQKEIAESKMFMIHNAIGEDARIFSPDETPQASELYNRLMTNPENMDSESIYTRVYLELEMLKKDYPAIIKAINVYPKRIKVAKKSSNNELITLIKKHNLYFVYVDYSHQKPQVLPFEEIWDKIKCNPQTNSLELSNEFWKVYLASLSAQNLTAKTTPKEKENRTKAINKLESLKNNPRFSDYLAFIELLLKDIYYLGTLSDFYLKKITQVQSPADIKYLKELLGSDYIQSMSKNIEHQSEIIIAIENQVNKN